MCNAWEVTDEDVAIVLFRNHLDLDPAQLFDDHFAGNTENCSRVEWAALGYSDIDEQCESALNEIEAILIEAGVIPAKS
jgi:hypothetical protein